MESALQITMVRENLALAIALWAAAQRGVITGAFVPGQIEFLSYTGQRVTVSTPLDVRDNQDLLRCINNQVRGAFAFSAVQTHRVLESVYGGDPMDEPDPDLRDARCVLSLLHETISQELIKPVWVCPPEYQRRLQVRPAGFVMDATILDSQKVYWEDFGGLNKYLDLLEYCSQQVQQLPAAAASPREPEVQPPVAPEPPAAAPVDTVVAIRGNSSSADSAEGFVEECCVVDPNALVIAKDLYSTYAGWCVQRGEEPLGRRSFGMQLTGLGFQRRRRGRGRHWWLGIGLSEKAQIKGASNPMPETPTLPGR